MTKDRSGWEPVDATTFRYRNRVAARTRARAEASAMGHVVGPFFAQGPGTEFFATCGRCARCMRQDIIAGTVSVPAGFLTSRCGTRA